MRRHGHGVRALEAGRRLRRSGAALRLRGGELPRSVRWHVFRRDGHRLGLPRRERPARLERTPREVAVPHGPRGGDHQWEESEASRDELDEEPGEGRSDRRSRRPDRDDIARLCARARSDARRGRGRSHALRHDEQEHASLARPRRDHQPPAGMYVLRLAGPSEASLHRVTDSLVITRAARGRGPRCRQEGTDRVA